MPAHITVHATFYTPLLQITTFTLICKAESFIVPVQAKWLRISDSTYYFLRWCLGSLFI